MLEEALESEGFVAAAPCSSIVQNFCEQEKLRNSNNNNKSPITCTVGELTAEATLDYFGMNEQEGILNNFAIKHQPMLGASVIGFDLRLRGVTTRLLIPWINCCLTQSCVSPFGATHLTHGFDESALSLAAYTYGATGRYTLQELGVNSCSVPSAGSRQKRYSDWMSDPFKGLREYQVNHSSQLQTTKP